ncbi:hypothetical protein LTS10_006623 [Elasticomyces elasticus]|nr:hypothetical protein LTS10_006623 [Elasticomyces elasticus]
MLASRRHLDSVCGKQSGIVWSKRSLISTMDPNVFIDPDDFLLLLATGGRTNAAGRSQPRPQSMPTSTANPTLDPSAALNVGGLPSGQEGRPTSTASYAPGPLQAPMRQYTATQYPHGYPVQRYSPPVVQHPQQVVNPQEQAVYHEQYVQQPMQQPTTRQYSSPPYQPQHHQPQQSQQSQQSQQPIGQHQPYSTHQTAQQLQVPASQPQVLQGPVNQSAPMSGPGYAPVNASSVHPAQADFIQQAPARNSCPYCAQAMPPRFPAGAVMQGEPHPEPSNLHAPGHSGAAPDAHFGDNQQPHQQAPTDGQANAGPSRAGQQEWIEFMMRIRRVHEDEYEDEYEGESAL